MHVFNLEISQTVIFQDGGNAFNGISQKFVSENID